MTKAPTRNTVRIIAGEFRSRKLEFPSLPGLRPTGDRIRETLFNWLQMDIRGARCLDLFAGSGALGFEAASRGAREVVMLDAHPQVVASLRANAAKLDCKNVTVLQADSLQWLENNSAAKENFAVVFLDPPFAQGLLPQTCKALHESTLLQNNARVYLESDAPINEEELPGNWSISKQGKAGQVYFYLAVTAPKVSDCEDTGQSQ